jgi:hypothetical protein
MFSKIIKNNSNNSIHISSSSSLINKPTLINNNCYHLNVPQRHASYVNTTRTLKQNIIDVKSKKELMDEALERGDLTLLLNYNTTIFSNKSALLKHDRNHDLIVEKIEETEEGVSLLCASVSTSKKNVVYNFQKFLISQNESKNFYTINCVYKLLIDKDTY